MAKEQEATALGPVSNGGQLTIETSMPYIATVRIVGVADILFHKWNVESVATKSKAAKGSKAKKTDDVPSYVWRLDNEEIGLPGEYLRQSIINAAKFRQDPRSPRKSAMDLYKAGVISLTPLATLGTTRWDYEDQRRVQVQRNGITRTRPAFKAGWAAEIDLLVNLPEYIAPDALQDVLVQRRPVDRGWGLPADLRPVRGVVVHGAAGVSSHAEAPGAEAKATGEEAGTGEETHRRLRLRHAAQDRVASEA